MPESKKLWALVKPLAEEEVDQQSEEVFRTSDGRMVSIINHGYGECRHDIRGLKVQLLKAGLAPRAELITNPDIVEDLMRQMHEAMVAATSRDHPETQPTPDCSE